MNFIILFFIVNSFGQIYSRETILDDGSGAEEPDFVEEIENATVPVGRSVKLSCSVKNLGTYKVAWMHFEQSAILTVNTHVITRNPRISVTHDKHRTWYLLINNVQEADRGRYMCQLNTISAKTQFGFLNVVVPPNIDDSLSSSDVIVREGANVSLSCHATGFPTPVIKWRRSDGGNITLNKTHSVMEWEGNHLWLTRISRLDMGAYLCIASNSVPPSISKRIKVSVDFPPQLLIPHQLVSVPIGYNVTLECFTEAHPASLNYWTRGDNQMLHDSRKYKSENIIGYPSFKIHMKLVIFNVRSDDFGMYKCVAKNPRGETDGVIRLYASEQVTTTIIPSTTTHLQSFLDVEIPAIIDDNEIGGRIYKERGGNRKDYNSMNNEINSEQKPRGPNDGWKKNGKNNKNAGETLNVGQLFLWKILVIIVLLIRNY